MHKPLFKGVQLYYFLGYGQLNFFYQNQTYHVALNYQVFSNNITQLNQKCTNVLNKMFG